jgi:hypothetical protein
LFAEDRLALAAFGTDPRIRNTAPANVIQVNAGTVLGG